MSRSLSVAGSLAILILAWWIVQLAKVDTFVSGVGAYSAAARPAATASSDMVATAVEDLAGWPIAAGR